MEIAVSIHTHNQLPNSAQQAVKEDLAKAYYIFAKYNMDDQTYTHLSAKVPGEEAYYIYPLGLLFDEASPDALIKVDFDGNIIEGKERNFNATGYVIHSSVYKARPEVNAVFHLHTTAGVAVSAMKSGLLPISQFALHFYNRMSYHKYDALSLDVKIQGQNIAKDLGQQNKAMLLCNHGTITCGETIQEAMFYMMFLENACKTQIAALSAGAENLIYPDPAVCEQAYQDMTAFEKGDVGKRDWLAHCRSIDFPWNG